MAKINRVIEPENSELVRDRIGEILIDEIGNQVQLSYDPLIDATVYVERSMPFDKTELPVVSVSLANGMFGNKSQREVYGTYAFNIDVFASAKSTKDSSGDTTSAFVLQKIMGICRSILEDPIYITLGFKPPFISRVWCSEMNIASTNKEDATNTAMGRLVFNVLVSEPSKGYRPQLIDGYETVIKIGNSSDGYFWNGENY